MHPFNATQPPKLAFALGLAGLVPFVSGALGLWVTPEAWRERVLEELLSYAAITLAFLGAIHWGLAMRAEDPYAPLAHGDLERLEQAARRVEELIEHCGAYMEEW